MLRGLVVIGGKAIGRNDQTRCGDTGGARCGVGLG